MSFLMQLCSREGVEVSGSDVNLKGHDAKNVEGVDAVVYSLAIKPDNVELCAARERGIRTFSRAQFLAEVAGRYECVLAVAGTHGKTTTTAMLWEIFRPLDPTVHIGGEYGGKRGNIGSKKIFITEACEYKRAFLQLRPDIGIILNTELDHTDCYSDVFEIREAFAQFERGCKKTLKGLTLEGEGYYSGRSVTCENGKYAFDFCVRGEALGRITLACPGRHFAKDALYAAAASYEYGLSFDIIREGLERFVGVARRFEYLGNALNREVYSDYAHHPSEITATINTAYLCGFKRPLVVFEPHTYTRTVAFAAEFVQSLKKADAVIILPVFAARESGDDSCAEALARDISKYAPCFFAGTYDEAYKIIEKTDCDAVIFMGAGSVDGAARRFVKIKNQA